MEALDFHRQMTTNFIRKAVGQATVSNQWAGLSVAPEEEQRLMELPIYTPTITPLQDNTGTFYFMLGYDNLDGAPLG